MTLTRFYRRTPIPLTKMRAVRDILAHSFNWELGNSTYCVYYPAEKYTVAGTDKLEHVLKERGEPHSFTAKFESNPGSILRIDTTDSLRIAVEASPVRDDPSKVLDAIGYVLGLTAIDAVPAGPKLASSFIAHGFGEPGRSCATELARFLGLIGLRVHSGRSYAPGSVAEKVQDRLARYDLVFAILTPHDDYTWITQEMAAAKAIGKPLFVLKQDDVDLKPGILGDLEYIPFPRDQIARTFIPILEGLKELRGEAVDESR